MASRKVFRSQRSESGRRSLGLVSSIGLTIVLSVLFTAFSNSFAHAQGVDSGASSSEDELIDVVFDGAELFSEDEEFELNLMAREFLDAYGVAMAVETVDSIGGTSIEQWTTSRAGERRVGSSELNNGLFYGIAVDDREFYVAKGDGYAEIPDSELQEILDSEMAPRFRDGDFATGIIVSAERFGALATGQPLPAEVEDPAVAAEREQAWAVGRTVLIFAVGAMVLGSLIFGAVYFLRRRREQILEEAARRERAEQLRQREEARQRRLEAFRSVERSEWREFAELPDGRARRSWLLDRDVYAIGFGTPRGERPSSNDVRLMDETIGKEHFGGAPFLPQASVRESVAKHAVEQERLKVQRREEAQQRQREDAVKRETRSFWQGLSSSERREFGRLRGDAERRSWISSHGGSTVLGMNPTLAFVTFMALSQSHTRAEAQSAQRSSTDYSGSSATSYTQSNYFGGGSFGGGGGAGGSW